MSTNVVVISGRLTADAESKTVGSANYDLTTFTLAFDVGWGDRKHACFVECEWWGKAGTAINQYLTKGKKVVVTGSWDQQSWQDNKGMKRRSDKITVSSVELGGGGSSEEQAERPVPSEPPTNAFEENVTF